MSRNRTSRRILEWEEEATRRKERHKERWKGTARRSTIDRGVTEGDTRDRSMRRNGASRGEKPAFSG